mmetsp:Transcript_52126/g.146321  ORF Transcript_52126/g.146321 Transcript_52126/m.146321 type:complete len:228 (+) Transcript_52126:784-1467(+)
MASSNVVASARGPWGATPTSMASSSVVASRPWGAKASGSRLASLSNSVRSPRPSAGRGALGRAFGQGADSRLNGRSRAAFRASAVASIGAPSEHGRSRACAASRAAMGGHAKGSPDKLSGESPCALASRPPSALPRSQVSRAASSGSDICGSTSPPRFGKHAPLPPAQRRQGAELAAECDFHGGGPILASSVASGVRAFCTSCENLHLLPHSHLPSWKKLQVALLCA